MLPGKRYCYSIPVRIVGVPTSSGPQMDSALSAWSEEDVAYMDASNKLELLKDVYEEGGKLDLVLGKLLEATLSDYRQRLDHYQTALQGFEQRFGMDSETFYQRFEAGSLGDDMDLFEWAGIYELFQNLLPQIHRLEQAL